MKLSFQIEAATLDIDIHTLIIAGWAGRDLAAIEHHIEELAALGIQRPARYRCITGCRTIN